MRKIRSSFECVQTTSAIGAILQRTKTIGEHRCQMLPLFVGGAHPPVMLNCRDVSLCVRVQVYMV